MKARDFYPGLGRELKIMPQDIAGILGLPYVGNVWYVDPDNGSDSANGGGSWDDAFATVGQAVDSLTNNNHDVVILAPGGTSGTTESAITWSMNQTHLIGNTAPSPFSPRARLLADTSTSPMLTVSGQGCSFTNVQLATFNDNNLLVTVTGNRNVFRNVHFAGIGNATTGDDTAARSLYLNGAEENRFVGCTIGLDTVMRSTSNAELEMAGGTTRNVFEDCRFVKAADNAGTLFVKSTGSSGLDRFNEFNNCSWYSFWTNDASSITAAFNLSAQTATAHILMTGRQILHGAADWEASASGRLFFEQYTETTTKIGLAINNA